MIAPPPLLTIRRRFERPSRAEIACFAGVSISMIADAQRGRGGLDHRIQPLEPRYAFAGPAVTTWCGAADNLGALAALEIAQAGDVIVIACDGFDGVGVVGDRYAGMARNKGLAGIVVDGLVRDRPGICAAAVPCYARGANASSALSLGPGEVGLPIAIGGVVIESGDMLVADGEGVIVVPQRSIARVLATLVEVKRAEEALNREVGEGICGFGWVAELMRTERTRYVD
ncbi:MAG: RraA family protein [Burkholderiales bacterium]|nr:RraA family protein [Burkholderiales bacterium]